MQKSDSVLDSINHQSRSLYMTNQQTEITKKRLFRRKRLSYEKKKDQEEEFEYKYFRKGINNANGPKLSQIINIYT